MKTSSKTSSRIACVLLLATLVTLPGRVAAAGRNAAHSDPSTAGVPLRRLVVVDVGRSGAERRESEERLAAVFGARGVECGPGYALLNDVSLGDVPARVGDCRPECDGVLVLRTVSDRAAGRSRPWESGFPSARGQHVRGPARASRGGIGSRVIDTELKLYRSSDAALVWSGIVHSRLSASAGSAGYSSAVANRVLIELERAKLVVRGGA